MSIDLFLILVIVYPRKTTKFILRVAFLSVIVLLNIFVYILYTCYNLPQVLFEREGGKAFCVGRAMEAWLRRLFLFLRYTCLY